ncbi:hypothetical protein [Occallatibacter riparius]|uniref:Uncharacterized protein n=1 Tax=Occallatibacter riparius TaxID=1002689 RepID=A0A9J7BSY0_9BACT|nr:hypothetical protein [Occallatibacter riparius]UWZ84125.1 hypothetical protein MOP44_26665 [Occallatibacter riparius]
MECDWEFEIAPDAPVIDAAWSEYINLRAHPELASHLSEAKALPALTVALTLLNAPDSPVWTAKCDVWVPESFDRDELDASPGQGIEALACYIDLLPATGAWLTMDAVAEWCRNLCVKLRTAALRQCRADLVVRRAFFTADQTGLGITAYLTACGLTVLDAQESLSTAVNVFASAVRNA